MRKLTINEQMRDAISIPTQSRDIIILVPDFKKESVIAVLCKYMNTENYPVKPEMLEQVTIGTNESIYAINGGYAMHKLPEGQPIDDLRYAKTFMVKYVRFVDETKTK